MSKYWAAMQLLADQRQNPMLATEYSEILSLEIAGFSAHSLLERGALFILYPAPSYMRRFLTKVALTPGHNGNGMYTCPACYQESGTSYTQ